MARTLRLEQPELKCVSIDLPHAITPATLDLLLADLLNEGTQWEDQIAYGGGGDRFVARLLPNTSNNASNNASNNTSDNTSDTIPQRLTIPDAESFRLGLSSYGVLDHLTLMPAKRQVLQPNDVEIQVKAAGVNFRDVLNALGMLQKT